MFSNTIMEKGDKPKPKESVAKSMTSSSTKVKKQKKPSASLMKEKKPKDKKPAKQKQKQKQKQENVQIVKVNVNTGKEEKPALMKPIRKEITKQITYVTLDKPYALQPEEEELLTITKHIPNPPRDKSRAKLTTLVSDPKNEIPQANIQDQPLASLKQIPVPIKKKVTAKAKGLFDVPTEIYVGAKPVLSVAKAKQSLLDEPQPEILKVIPQKKPRKIKEPKYDVPVEIFEPKKRTLGKTTEEEQPLLSVAEEVTTKAKKSQKVKEIIPSTNSSSIDKSIQNSSINNNEKVQELVIAETMEDIITKTESKDKEKEVFDYITNADDANISNPNSGEKINIQNENELEEEFGLTSAQVESYKEEYTMTPKGSVEGLTEQMEKSPRGRPAKYATDEERLRARKEQKKASSIRIREGAKAIKQMQTDIEYEEFIQGNYPALSLEEMLLKDIVIPEKEFAEGYFASMSADDLGQNLGQDIVVSSKEKPLTTLMKPDISSDFASSLVDKLSDNNNFGSIQSAQESQFDFE